MLAAAAFNGFSKRDRWLARSFFVTLLCSSSGAVYGDNGLGVPASSANQMSSAIAISGQILVPQADLSSWPEIASAPQYQTHKLSDAATYKPSASIGMAAWPQGTEAQPAMGKAPGLELAQIEAPQNAAEPATMAAPAQEIDAASHGGRMLNQPYAAGGSSGSSMDDLDLALGQRPTFGDQPEGQSQIYNDLSALQNSIADLQRPVTNLVTRYSGQSDHLTISQTELSQDFFLNDGAARIQPGIQYVSYSPMTGPSAIQNSAGFDGNYRMSDFAAVAGDFWANSLASKGVGTVVIPTYDVFLTLWPSDYVRMDFDNKREIFDNIISLRDGITDEVVSGSADYTPRDGLRFTVRGGGAFYSDSNDRQFADAEAIWRVNTGPTIEVGLRASTFHFSELLNDGYFNPKNYYSGEGMFQLQSALTNRLNVELDASGGIEQVDPGGAKPLVKSSLQFAYKLSNNWTLDAGISYFSSRESTSAGFDRTTANFGLHYRFD